MSEDYVMWGSAGHAMVLSEILRSHNINVVALFDNDVNAVSVIDGVEIFYGRNGYQEWLKYQHSLEKMRFTIAIGGSRGLERLELSDYLRASGVLPGIVVADSATVSPTAFVNDGSQILNGAIIGAKVSIGRECVVNNGAQIDHESVIGDGVHVSPGAVVCGCVRVGSGSFLGAGCVVLPRIEIGDSVIVGAGAVVTRNVGANTTVIGNPARQMT